MDDFYSAVNKNEIMAFVGKWTELDIIMLSKKNLRKINILWFPIQSRFKFRLMS